MYLCNDCKNKVEPINHNGRGNRCPLCWSTDLVKVEPKPQPKPEPKPQPVKPATRRKKAAN